MGARVVAALLGIAARHPAETVLVVSHGGAIRACQAAAADLRYEQFRRAPTAARRRTARSSSSVVAEGRLAEAAG